MDLESLKKLLLKARNVFANPLSHPEFQIVDVHLHAYNRMITVSNTDYIALGPSIDNLHYLEVEFIDIEYYKIVNPNRDVLLWAQQYHELKIDGFFEYDGLTVANYENGGGVDLIDGVYYGYDGDLEFSIDERDIDNMPREYQFTEYDDVYSTMRFGNSIIQLANSAESLM